MAHTGFVLSEGTFHMTDLTPAIEPINAQSLADALPHLRRPFTAEAVKYKIQTNPKTEGGAALIVAFIDARLAGERLNAVCPGEWGMEFLPVSGGMMCKLTVFGVTRCDVGWSKGTDADMPLKTLYSDAFKRAAVHFGIGVSLYSLPQMRLKEPAIKGFKGRNGMSYYIQRSGEASLRETYEQFLSGPKGKVFGRPLDHGDAADSQGGEEVLATRTENAGEDDAPKQAPKPKAKAAPKQRAAVADDLDRPISDKGAAACAAMFVKAGKTTEDVKNFLVSKGVEDTSAFDSLALEDAMGTLTAAVGQALYEWLKGASK